MEFLKSYRKVRKIFKKPKLRWYFGTWRNFNGLPVWREGPTISLWTNFNDYHICDMENGSKYAWSDFGIKNHPFLSKILPPVIQLPIWLRFGMFSKDVTWKAKWSSDDIRYLFPPQFCLVFFGLCIGVIAEAPFGDEDDYWATILKYLYCYDKDIEKTAQNAWFIIGDSGYFIESTFDANWLKNEKDAALVRSVSKKIIEMKKEESKK